MKKDSFMSGAVSERATVAQPKMSGTFWLLFGHENVTENAVRRLRNPHKYAKSQQAKSSLTLFYPCVKTPLSFFSFKVLPLRTAVFSDFGDV